MTNSPKNLLLGLKIIVWLCVLSSSDKLLAYINCCKTHHQPNSFTHSLINLLYWAYWAHILFYLGLGYDLWPYTYLGKKKKIKQDDKSRGEDWKVNIKNWNFHFLFIMVNLIGGWKSKRMEKEEMMEKWKDRKDFSFSYLCLIEGVE